MTVSIGTIQPPTFMSHSRPYNFGAKSNIIYKYVIEYKYSLLVFIKYATPSKFSSHAYSQPLLFNPIKQGEGNIAMVPSSMHSGSSILTPATDGPWLMCKKSVGTLSYGKYC
jgi:hypothetical protein